MAEMSISLPDTDKALDQARDQIIADFGGAETIPLESLTDAYLSKGLSEALVASHKALLLVSFMATEVGFGSISGAFVAQIDALVDRLKDSKADGSIDDAKTTITRQ